MEPNRAYGEVAPAKRNSKQARLSIFVVGAGVDAEPILSFHSPEEAEITFHDAKHR